MKEYSLSDVSDSATAIIAYTIRAMNNCGFSKMQIDRYIKMIKSLSYNELVDLSNSILSSCNDYIKDLYNDANDEDDMDKKLEARITRLEKLVSKNEDFDEDKVKFKDAYIKACGNLSACISNLNKMYTFGDSMHLTYDIGDVI